LINEIKKNLKSFKTTVSLPLSYCANFHVDHYGAETTPSFNKKYSKLSLGRGLVKISTNDYFVPTYSNLMFFSVTCFLRK